MRFTDVGWSFRYDARQTLLMQALDWGWIMRNTMPTRWIEEAESRRVITDTLAEGQPTPSRHGLAEDALHLSTRLLLWLTTRQPMGWPASQTQPH